MIKNLPRLFWQIFIPLLILAGLTAWFRWTDEDIGLIRGMRATSGIVGWEDADTGIWGFLKIYGVIPAFVMTFVALVGVFAGLVSPKLAHWVRPSVYLIMVFVIGAGVISNGILKEHWGRPRPKHVIELGGNETFVKVLTPAFGADGKSFPCGHATTGFFFFSVGLLMRNRRRTLSILATTFALVLGTMLGISRMLQGGHFPSDVLWAAGIMWFISLGLLYAMGLQHFMETPLAVTRSNPRHVKWIGALIAVGVASLLTVGLVSIPRNRAQHINLPALKPDSGQLLEFDFKGSLRVAGGENARLDVDFDGCGTPKSKPGLKVSGVPAGFRIFEKSTGFFTEKNFNATLILPPGNYQIRCLPSVKRFDQPAGFSSQMSADGLVHVHIPASPP